MFPDIKNIEDCFVIAPARCLGKKFIFIHREHLTVHTNKSGRGGFEVLSVDWISNFGCDQIVTTELGKPCEQRQEAIRC